MLPKAVSVIFTLYFVGTHYWCLNSYLAVVMPVLYELECIEIVVMVKTEAVSLVEHAGM